MNKVRALQELTNNIAKPNFVAIALFTNNATQMEVWKEAHIGTTEDSCERWNFIDFMQGAKSFDEYRCYAKVRTLKRTDEEHILLHQTVHPSKNIGQRPQLEQSRHHIVLSDSELDTLRRNGHVCQWILTFERVRGETVLASKQVYMGQFGANFDQL
jgi:hypothetical protein